MISSNSNSINDIIICIDNSLVNLEKIKQDLSINNQQNNIIQFLTNLSYDLQNIINLLKCFNQKENMNNEKINNLQNQIYCFENELLNSNNKIRELNFLICDKECTIHELLNQKNNFCICNCNCPYCNSNMNNHELSTKSTFYNKKNNNFNLSYDCNNLMNSQNIPKKKNLSFDCGNDILEKTSNILNINKTNRNYFDSPLNRNFSLTPSVQNIQKFDFNTPRINDNLRFHNSYDNFNKINLNQDKNNNETINENKLDKDNKYKNEKDLNKDNINKTNLKSSNKTKKDKNIKIENNKIIHDIIPKNNYSFNFQKMNLNKKTKSSSLPKEDINKLNKKKKISPPKNSNSNTINTKKKPNQKIEYKFKLDEPEPEKNPKKPISQSSMNKNSFTQITKNINPNTIKKNYINDPNQLNNNLYINENQIEMNQELSNNQNKNNLKDKINRIENIIQNALKDENTINKLKKKLGDNFIEKITKEDVTEDYLNKVENTIKEINLRKDNKNNFTYNQYSNLKNNNQTNFPKKKFKDPVVNSLYNKQKLKKEITDNKYNFKEYPRSWISSKDYFVNNNNQNGKIEKSSLKIPNFP